MFIHRQMTNFITVKQLDLVQAQDLQQIDAAEKNCLILVLKILNEAPQDQEQEGRESDERETQQKRGEINKDVRKKLNPKRKGVIEKRKEVIFLQQTALDHSQRQCPATRLSEPLIYNVQYKDWRCFMAFVGQGITNTEQCPQPAI